MSRRKARDITFKYIYSTLYGSVNMEDEIESILTVNNEEISSLEDDEKEYLDKLVSGISEKKAEIDSVILSKLKNWSIDRIFKIDLAILRLAIYEIMYLDNVPVKVSANEAVELAKKYGIESSPTFVNGVIREVIKDKEEEKENKEE